MDPDDRSFGRPLIAQRKAWSGVEVPSSLPSRGRGSPSGKVRSPKDVDVLVALEDRYLTPKGIVSAYK